MRHTYCKVILKQFEPSLPCCNDSFADFRSVWDIAILKVFTQQKKKITKFMTFNDINRLKNSSRQAVIYD